VVQSLEHFIHEAVPFLRRVRQVAGDVAAVERAGVGSAEDGIEQFDSQPLHQPFGFRGPGAKRPPGIDQVFFQIPLVEAALLVGAGASG
jgi:hypothetical protein